jgi:hypothetical protein
METIDHVALGLSRLPAQYRESPILKELLTIYLEELQEIEDCLIDIVNQKDVDQAIGFQLDIIGEHVGVLRQGRDDAEYRQAIKIQKIINASQGQYETVLQLWRLLLNSPTATLMEEFPAGINLYSDVGISDFTIVDYLVKALPVTVNAGLTTSFDADPPFGFDTDPTTLGFDTSGGKFIGRYAPLP